MIVPDVFPILTTERLVLRSLDERDVDAIFAIFRDPEVSRYSSSPPMAEIGEARALLDRAVSSFSQHAAIRWAITRGTDGLVIGTCNVFHVDEQNRRGELGYALKREFWGNGFIHEALSALLDYAFGTLHLHRLEADIDPRNGASIRAVERLGFQREGIRRERWHVAGEISDSLMMGLLSREWQSGNLAA
jgi:ribosomal-protein-alanine N-acetyltransferase